MGVFKSILALLGRDEGLSVPSLDAPASAGSRDLDDDDDIIAQRDDDDVLEAWSDMKMFIQRCEAEALDLAGLDLRDPTTFTARQVRIDRLQLAGRSYLQSVVASGFVDVKHWEQVRRYYRAKWSYLAEGSRGRREIRQHQDYVAAEDASVTTLPAVDPRALEPVRGVTLEQWARAAAVLSRTSTHASAEAIDAALAACRIDRATYDVVNVVWQERMRRDASLTIAARFGQAFDRDPEG